MHLIVCACVDIASNPGSLSGGGEREHGTHYLRMSKIYGDISSIIRRTLSLPRGQTYMDKVYYAAEVREV